ncbi:MAG TPA: NACHT domain-containing protein [Actinophytocola sp.]|uniref:NACHT domain-containing protein n=1 Tax=Actinophytocola sp. TaxID=1872138 RepID=UPI002DDCB14C|nr:NACHT domain-containing protein [Actinophytocola sp.]HEV2779373.1 NACHT domain-containing protein [Actinophytocola sp.]
MRRRPAPVTAAVVAIALALAGNVATNTIQITTTWGQLMAWTVVALLAVVVVVDTVRGKARSQGENLHAIAEDLAAVVRKQWQDEAAHRELNDPYPLPVRWRHANPELFADWADVERLAKHGAGWPPPHAWARSMIDLAGADGDLAAVWESVPTGRLVVLGEPGTGKTMLLVRLVLDLLAVGRRQPGTPVPILVSVASWDPTSQDLYGWLADRLALDYPALGRRSTEGTLARAMLDRGLITMILDGLDEIPAPVRGSAIAGINQAIRPGQRLIVSSRIDAYREAVRPPSGIEVTLTGATGIQLCPLTAHDVVSYLRTSAGGPAGEERWDDVATALTGSEPSAAQQALVTPLMATLARTIYNPRAGEAVTSLPHPSELLTRTSPAAVEQHLFDGFIPAAYRPHPSHAARWNPDRARKWLGNLAHHLEHDHHGTPDLAWWRLHIRRNPIRPTAAHVLAIGCLVAVVAGLAAALLHRLSANLAIVAGPHVGVTTALAYGIVFWLTGRLKIALIAALIVGIAAGFTVGLGSDLGLAGQSPLNIALVTGLAAGFTHRLRDNAPTGLRAGFWAGAAVWVAYLLSGALIILIGTGDWSGFTDYALAVLTDAVKAGLLVGLVTRLTAAVTAAGRIPGSRVTGVIGGLLITTVTGLADGISGGLTSFLVNGLRYGLAAGLLMGVTTWLVVALTAGRFGPGGGMTSRPLLVGTLAGLAFGLADGFRYAFDASDGTISRFLAALLVGTLRSGLTAGLTVGAVAVVTSRSVPRRGTLVWPLVAGALAGLAIFAVGWLTEGILYGASLDPRSRLAEALSYGLIYASTISLARFARSAGAPALVGAAVAGVGYGLFSVVLNSPSYGLATGFAVALAVEVARRLTTASGPAQSPKWTIGGLSLAVLMGSLAGITVWFYGDIEGGVTAGVLVAGAVWLVYGIDVRPEITTVHAPGRVLTRDRNTFAVLSTAIALVVATLFAFAASEGQGHGFDALTCLVALGYGVAAGTLVAAGRSAWPNYFLALCRLALTGRAPWPLMAFLSDAHSRRGVLRQNGATYQFRHLYLQRRLAGKVHETHERAAVGSTGGGSCRGR